MKKLGKNFAESAKMLILGLIMGAGMTYAAGFVAPSGPPTTFNSAVPINTSAIAQVKDGSLVTKQLGSSYTNPNAITFQANDAVDSFGNAWFQGGNYWFYGKSNLLGDVDIGPTQLAAPAVVNLDGKLSATGHVGVNSGNVAPSGASDQALGVDHGSVRVTDLPANTGAGYTIEVCADASGVLGVCN